MKTLALALMVAALLTGGAFGAEQKLYCTLANKEVKTCCCEQQKNGKLLCKLTGKTVDKCCCKGM